MDENAHMRAALCWEFSAGHRKLLTIDNIQSAPDIGCLSCPHLWTKNFFTIWVAPWICDPKLSASIIIHWVVTSLNSDCKYFGSCSLISIWNYKNEVETIRLWVLELTKFMLPVERPGKMLHRQLFEMVPETWNYFYRSLTLFELFYTVRFS